MVSAASRIGFSNTRNAVTGTVALGLSKDESFMAPPLVAADGLTTIDGDLLTTTSIVVLYVCLRLV